MVFCPYCGINNPEDYNYCNNCQKSLIDQKTNRSSLPKTITSKSKIIIVILIITVVLALIILSTGKGDDSPESAFNRFINYTNEGEYSNCIHQTDAHFLNLTEFNDILAEMIEWSDSEGIIIIHDIKSTYRNQMTTTEITGAVEYSLNFEIQTSKEVQNFSIVEYVISQGNDVQSGEFLCIKVEESWYIALYFEGLESGFTTTPAGSASVEVLSQTQARLIFGQFTETVAPTEIRIYVYYNGVSAGSITIPTSTGTESTQLCDWTDGTAGVSAIYFDYNPEGGTINQGDYLRLSGLQPESTYSIELYHIPTDSVIYMVGANSFTTD